MARRTSRRESRAFFDALLRAQYNFSWKILRVLSLSLSLCVCVFNALLAPLLPPPGVVSSEDEDGSSLSLSLFVLRGNENEEEEEEEKRKI